MSKTVGLRSILLAGVAAASVSVPGAVMAQSLEEFQGGETIQIAIANEIPYGYVDPTSGEAMGAGPDVAKAVLSELGIENVEWITTEFSSLIPGLQADRFDMVAAEMAVNPERCAAVIYSEPNSSYGEGLLVPADNPKGINSYEQFAEDSELRVAIMAGANQLEMMQNLGVSEDQMVTISSNADAISTVSTGRADAYAATGLTASELAGQSDQVKVAEGFTDPVIDGTEQRSWGAFAFANGSEELRDAFNEALTTFKESDEWEEILTGYGFTDADVSRSFDMSTEELCSSE